MGSTESVRPVVGDPRNRRAWEEIATQDLRPANEKLWRRDRREVRGPEPSVWDPERRWWIVVAGLACGAMIATVAIGVTHALGNTPVVVPVAEPPQPVPVQASGSLLTALLPLGVGGFWLVGAWIIDHEGRRALIIREPWGERRTIAYGLLALFVVFPLILGGLLISAWGTVQVLADIGRQRGTEAAWRGVVGAATALVLFVSLRRPFVAGMVGLVRRVGPFRGTTPRNDVG